jgi:hypothetical protein
MKAEDQRARVFPTGLDRTIHGTGLSSAGDSTNDSQGSQTMCASFTAPTR